MLSWLKRVSEVHTVMIADARAAMLAGIMRDYVQPDGAVYTDLSISYDVLDISDFCRRVNDSAIR